MFNWYMLFSLIGALWVPVVGFASLLVFLLTMWCIFLAKKYCLYSSESDFKNEEVRKCSSDAKSVYELWKFLRKPVLYIVLAVCVIFMVFWPTQERLIKSYAVSEVFKYIKANPDAAMNPQNLLGTVNEIFEVVNTGLGKLLELMK